MGIGAYITPDDPNTTPTAPVSPTEATAGPPLWDLARLKQGILLAEGTGGRDDLVSPKMARGRWQVTDDTARDPGLGLQPVNDLNNMADRNRLGEQYIEKLWQKYGSDYPLLAAAAYNAGFGRVDRLMAKYGDPRNNQISMEDFITKLPPETQKYVRTVAGGDLAIKGQTPPAGPVTVAATSTAPEATNNQLAMKPPPSVEESQEQMRRFMAMAMMRALLPKGFGFQPVDFHPFQQAQAVGRMSGGGISGLPGLVAPHSVVLGSGQGPSVMATSPRSIPRLGQKGPGNE